MKRSPVGWIASGLGLGASPVAPGTAGTLVGVPLALGIASLPAPLQVAALLLLLPVGAWICGRAADEDGGGDPGWVVFDEVVGYCYAVALLPPAVGTYAAAFLLFRLFDILKPPPAREIDRALKGGWGILLDDVVAGLYARAVLALFHWLV